MVKRVEGVTSRLVLGASPGHRARPRPQWMLHRHGAGRGLLAGEVSPPACTGQTTAAPSLERHYPQGRQDELADVPMTTENSPGADRPGKPEGNHSATAYEENRRLGTPSCLPAMEGKLPLIVSTRGD